MSAAGMSAFARSVMLATLLVGLASCGRSTLDQHPAPDLHPRCNSGLGIAGLPACAPREAAACLDFVSSPTSSPAAEILAWRLDGSFLATRTTLSRIRSDLAVLASAEPLFAQVASWRLDSCMSVEVSFEAAAYQSMLAGTYAAWDCINGLYGAAPLHPLNSARLGLSAHYNARIVARQYAALPGVVKVDAGCPYSFLTNNRDLCISRQGDSLLYVLYRGSGDCPMGCTSHTYRYYAVDASHAITAAAAWSSVSGTPRPDWTLRHSGCIYEYVHSAHP